MKEGSDEVKVGRKKGKWKNVEMKRKEVKGRGRQKGRKEKMK
jgi:hypothetical protein